LAPVLATYLVEPSFEFAQSPDKYILAVKVPMDAMAKELGREQGDETAKELEWEQPQGDAMAKELGKEQGDETVKELGREQGDETAKVLGRENGKEFEQLRSISFDRASNKCVQGVGPEKYDGLNANLG
jgi:hypothetical protein